MPTPPITLTIAGSDPSGGAGLEADLKTFAALGTYGTAVTSGLTAQNTTGVTGVLPTNPDFVRAQIESVLSDLSIGAAKCGALFNRDVIATVSEALINSPRFLGVPLVVDPVMVSTSGDRLLDEEAVETYGKLLRRAMLITPNDAEALVLARHLGCAVSEQTDRTLLARVLFDILEGPSVLITGGDKIGNQEPSETVIDLLFHDGESQQMTAPRIATPHAHGSGCTLSAAICSRLAQGDDLIEAVKTARRFVQAGLAGGCQWRIGSGRGPLNHWGSQTQRISRRGVFLGVATLMGLQEGKEARADSTKRVKPRTDDIRLRMVTSWTADSPGPGQAASRFAQLVQRWSQGRLTIDLHPAGHLVPALEVFDAVRNGAADLAHTASAFWRGKMGHGVAFFTSVPFGFDPVTHEGWLRYGGGQALWNHLYQPLDLRPLSCGNTGSNVLGWFRSPLRGIDDVVGLKIRAAGFAADFWRALGARPISLAPHEIVEAFRSNLIDAAEYAGPAADVAIGLSQVARVVHVPGVHEPNGTAELLISERCWQRLTPPQRQMITDAAQTVNDAAIVESRYTNAVALERAVQVDGVQRLIVPEALLRQCRQAFGLYLRSTAASDSVFASILASQQEYAKSVDVVLYPSIT